MPRMRTYPPAGIALIPYSVSPLRTDHSRGPNPRKYSVTFIPLSLAAVKWPASWSMITPAITATVTSTGRKWPSTASTTSTNSTASNPSSERRWSPGVGGGGGAFDGLYPPVMPSRQRS